MAPQSAWWSGDRPRLRISAWVLPLIFSLLLFAGRCSAQDNPNQQNQPQSSGQQENQTEANSPDKNPDKQIPNAQPDPGQKSGDSSQQNPADSTPEKKGDNPGPVQVVAGTTRQVATTTLIRLRDWEVGWLTGPFVGKEGQLVSLTAPERQRIYLQQTLTTPGAYLKRAFIVGIDQARGWPSQWDDGWGGYAERFASREGQFVIANSLAALGNAKLGYEVRYDQCRCSGFWPRTHHAIGRNFVTYDRSEHQRRPQWALYGGAFAGGLISTAWKPHPRDAFAEGGRAVLGQAGWGTLLNFFIEFADDINRKLGARKRHDLDMQNSPLR